MNRKGHLSECVGTPENMEQAFRLYSKGKMSRDKVKDYNKDLWANSQRLACMFMDGTWRTSEYIKVKIYEPKVRTISKLPTADHVIQWGVLIYIEKMLCDTYIRNSFSCVKGWGTHDFMRVFYHDLNTDRKGSVYVVQLDAHHYFENIVWFLVMAMLRRKIKDEQLLSFLEEFVKSHIQGLPLGVKISQILANFLLYVFDHDAQECLHIAEDRRKMHYWRNRYIESKIATAKTVKERADAAKGRRYLGAKFDAYVKQSMRHKYYRFADNMLMRHADKTFLHIMTELAIMVLARDYFITVNGDWNVRPVRDGTDVCGYVFYNDHIRLRKRNKKALCREVARLRKKGLSPEEIRLKTASRIGFATHADCKNLLRKLNVNMEQRLGKKIRDRKRQPPFDKSDVHKNMSDIVCPLGCEDEERYLIMLDDYNISDSKIKKGEKMLALRFRVVVGKTVREDGSELYQYEKTEEGNTVEYFAYTGSEILIGQADLDFNHGDLPSPTVIREFKNKFNKKFYKFT